MITRKKIDQSIKSGNSSLNIQVAGNLELSLANFPKELVDEKLKSEIRVLRQSRFFIEFDRADVAISLATRVVSGELSGGSECVRSQALAWCARILILTDEEDKAAEYYALSKTICSCLETHIAGAFISAKHGDISTALRSLAKIDLASARSAAFMIIANNKSTSEAFEWIKKSKTQFNNLDSDGKYFYIAKHLELSEWESANEAVEQLNEDDYENSPVLYRVSAISLLISIIPEELRNLVLHQLPLDAANFPLFSDAVSTTVQKEARSFFIEAAIAEKNLNCNIAAAIDSDYALWLELKDTNDHEQGRKNLEEKLRDTQAALRLVPLGMQFGVNLNLAAVEREIERNTALNGGITYDAAIARLALAFAQGKPLNIANYIEQYHDDLFKVIDLKLLSSIQIEMLARAGLPKKAHECLDFLKANVDELTEFEESRLRAIISESEGSDPIELRKTQFKKTGLLNDLIALVDALEDKKEWNDLCEFSMLLFDKTRTKSEAERLTTSLNNARKLKQIVEFAESNLNILSQSKILQMHYAWALYYEGRLLDARKELAKLNNDSDDPNYRALLLNISIAIGDWHSLSVYVTNEFAVRDKRTAEDLLRTAQLALHLNLHHAKDLIYSAVEKAGNDANILSSAYFMATTAGWEDNEKVASWLQKAADLSGDQGPIQRMTLKDIVDRKPDWDRRESETWQSMSRGELPIFLAAHSLNKTLVELMLFPALANLNESDTRKRVIIPAYSGQRQYLTIDLSKMTVSIDATALLTLSFLNVLDIALDTFENIHIAHSTLGWLFEEKQKVSFHQPSQIKTAHQIRDFLSRGIVEKLIPSTIIDDALLEQVDENLALLLTEAKKTREDCNKQRLVVRPSPVYRIASLMEEEAELSAYTDVMCSCIAVINNLRKRGKITDQEEHVASTYLKLHETPWPDQPEIDDGAVLYLDDLATTYFHQFGLLEKINSAGFTLIVTSSELSKVNQLIRYESLLDKVSQSIEQIREVINSRIESGKIIIDSQPAVTDVDTQSIANHPTYAALAQVNACDAIIVDDRYLNKNAFIEISGKQSQVLTTLNLLEALVLSGSLSSNKLMEYKTLLRRAGYIFMPLEVDELLYYVLAATTNKQLIVETVELKAIRENILKVRMSDWLQLPAEAYWLDTILKVFSHVLKDLWTDDAVIPEVTAKSNWIMDQVDIRGWAHSFDLENADELVRINRGAYLLLFIMPPFDAPLAIQDAYSEWIEIHVLAQIKNQFPKLYAWLVQILKTQVRDATEDKQIQEELN